jgi:hypothetical protein
VTALAAALAVLVMVLILVAVGRLASTVDGSSRAEPARAPASMPAPVWRTDPLGAPIVTLPRAR